MEILVVIIVIIKSFISCERKLIIDCSEFTDAVGHSDLVIGVVINSYIIIGIKINYTEKLSNKVERCVAKRTCSRNITETCKKHLNGIFKSCSVVCAARIDIRYDLVELCVAVRNNQ